MECCRSDDVIAASLAVTFSHRATFDEQMLLLLLDVVVVVVAVVAAVVVVDFDTVLHFSLACETVSSCARPRWAPPTLTATYFLIIKYTLSAPVFQHTKVQT